MRLRKQSWQDIRSCFCYSSPWKWSQLRPLCCNSWVMIFGWWWHCRKNRCTSYWRILWVDIRYLKELSLVTSFSISHGTERKLWWRYTSASFLLWLFWKESSTDFSKKEKCRNSGAIAHFAHKKADHGFTSPSYHGSWFLCSGIMLSLQFIQQGNEIKNTSSSGKTAFQWSKCIFSLLIAPIIFWSPWGCSRKNWNLCWIVC